MNITKQFAKYVSQNIAGMIGISVYILADTFFIAQAVGSDGITALNLVLPLYSLIFAIGAMIGVGSAIRYTVERMQGGKNTEKYFSNALLWATILGLLFLIIGGCFPKTLMRWMGGDENIVALGSPYTRIVFFFTPFFLWNHICNAFVRNDGSPSIAMAATLLSSLFNVVGDYVLMFPLGLGMRGAALATALSPVLGVAICCVHFFSKRSSLKLRLQLPELRLLLHSAQVGVSAFVGEISSGVITFAFNSIILRLTGNTGVAAYGVVANTALVAVAMFNGVSQGSQPLVSECYGRGEVKNAKKVLRLGIGTSLVLAALLFLVTALFAAPITAVFNREQDPVLAGYAEQGLRLYFIGFWFAGINIVGSGMLSAMESVRAAFLVSVLRGFVLIVGFAFLLSFLFGMTGVWLAFPAAEAGTMLVTVWALRALFSSTKENRQG